MQGHIIADDYAKQANVKEQHILNLDLDVIYGLQKILNNSNPYVKNALEYVSADKNNYYKFVISIDKLSTAANPGRYIAIMAKELAVSLDNQKCNKRDIVFHI